MVQHPIAISCGLVQFHPNPPKQVHVPLGIPHLHPLFGHMPGLDAAHGPQRIDHLKGEALMLTRDETRASSIHLAQKGTGTEVAVLNPEIVGLHGLQDQS
jgi:hypothetical protein